MPRPLLKPFFNEVLVEVIDEYSQIVRADKDEHMQRGKVLDHQISEVHLTASSGVVLPFNFVDDVRRHFDRMKEDGIIIRWAEFADSGQTFKHEGKTLAFVPWYRVIGFELEAGDAER